MQVRSVKPIIFFLPHDLLVGLRREEQVPSWLKWLIDGTDGTIILEENHGRICGPGLGKQKADRRNKRLMSWHSFGSRNKSILDINYDQGVNGIDLGWEGSLHACHETHKNRLKRRFAVSSAATDPLSITSS